MNHSKEQPNFHTANRRRLYELVIGKHAAELIVVTANSFMQASADRAYPFQQDSNFFYLTGITEPEVILVIDSEGEYLIVPDRDAVRTAFEGAIDTRTMQNVSGVHTTVTAAEGWKRLGKRLKKLKKVATLAPPEGYIAHYEMFTNSSRQRLLERMHDEANPLENYDVRKHLSELRMIKSSYEITMIQQAIRETCRLFELIEQVRSTSTNEHELLAEITHHTVKRQLKYAYDPIIASGVNALTLHYVKNNAQLNKKSLLLLDIGLAYNGYAADITRTISYAPTKRQQQVYDAVNNVHAYAVSIVKPGITMKEYEEQIFQRMGKQLQELGLITEVTKESVREFYPHSTSHFLGIDVHDAGDYSKPLEAGMVLTVEPGIYIKQENIGIRLEDDVLITPNGNKVLSNALPKNLSSLTIQP